MADSHAPPSASRTPPTPAPVRRWTVRLLLGLAAVFLAAHLLLPLVLERLVLPGIFETAGIRDYAFPIRRLGLFGLEAGPLRIGPEADPGISVLSARATFGPRDLLQGRIPRLTLDGVRLRVREEDETGLGIPGLPLRDDAAAARPISPDPLPVFIAAIEIRHGELALQQGPRHLRLPFAARISPEPGMTAFEGTLELDLTGQPMTVGGRVDLAANRLAAEWVGRDIRLDLLARRAGLAPWTHLSGSGWTRGRVQGRLTPLEVDALEATFGHSPCRLIWDTIRLDLAGGGDSGEMQVHVTNAENNRWAVSTSPVQVAAEGGGGTFELEGTLENLEDGGLGWSGSLAAALAFDPAGRGLPPLRLWPQRFDVTALRSPGGRWQVVLGRTPGEGPDPRFSDMGDDDAVSIDLAAFEATVMGDGASLDADFHWRLPAFAATMGDLRIAAGAVEGRGRWQTEGGGSGPVSVTADALTVQDSGWKAGANQVVFEGAGAATGASPFALSGTVTLRGGRFRLTEPAVGADGLDGRLPVAWPPPGKGTEGVFELDAITWDGRPLGSVAGQLRQTAEGLSFRARHRSRLVPALRVAAEGEAGLAPADRKAFARIRWTADRPADAAPLALSELMPDPPAIPVTLSGRLFARGEMAYMDGLSGSLTAGIEAGRLQVDQQGLVIEGLETALHIPDVARLRSAPGQELRFGTVSFGAIRAEDGRLDYQIEPGGVLFLEGGRFRWCGGTVLAPASRFAPGAERYALTVFCDRLRLDRLLEQLGLAEVEGGGAISGVIPVALDDGRLIFDNAFLYSTPGEGGVIRVQGSEVLTAGIPAGTPQYNQIELARHALKDYDYEWAKITMNTLEENLLVQLQFDGKPAGPLPFVYDPAAGGFVRTDPGQPGSVFQGIRLDVNVTLPLDRMLRYRELFKRLQ